ncbi:hypothetical protein PVAG01_00143 [Phlyctema vagabunda]|uniref:Uncharacterized protein n=1 Tax=Phlyctema vagabunda TaxID=108571 RepID=A0ABR4PTF3_9HELO
MTAIPLTDRSLDSLRDKVVVLTGGAHGIGAATVAQLFKAGAKVVHCDWDEIGGQKVTEDLLANAQSSDGTVDFVKTDVSNYESVLRLFDYAFKKHGQVDIAIANAGISEEGDYFDPSLDLESVKQKPSTRTIDVDLNGVLFFARIAAVYLKQGAQPNQDKSLVLVSSAAGFTEAPGIFAYAAAKHGVLGLLRALRVYLPKTHGIRVNSILPWMTDTVMAEGMRDAWVKEDMPMNTSDMVGRVMIEVAANGKWNGRAVFVEGGRGWDIDEGIARTQPLWLGEQVSATLNKGQVILGDGTDWANRKTKL